MLFLTQKELTQKKIKPVKVHYLIFALNYFVDKFGHEKLQQNLFILFFSIDLTKNVLDLANPKLADPPFYSFEFNPEYKISRINLPITADADSDCEQVHMNLLYKKHILNKQIDKDILEQFSKTRVRSKDILFHTGLSEMLGVRTNFVAVGASLEKLRSSTVVEELKNPKMFKVPNHFISSFNLYLRVNGEVTADQGQQFVADFPEFLECAVEGKLEVGPRERALQENRGRVLLPAHFELGHDAELPRERQPGQVAHQHFADRAHPGHDPPTQPLLAHQRILKREAQTKAAPNDFVH